MISFCIFCQQVGFRNDAETAIQFIVTVAALSVAMNALGHLLLNLAPSVAVATIFSGLLITLFSLFPGFYIPYTLIPKGWIWFYWANPIAHGFRGECADVLPPTQLSSCREQRLGGC